MVFYGFYFNMRAFQQYCLWQCSLTYSEYVFNARMGTLASISSNSMPTLFLSIYLINAPVAFTYKSKQNRARNSIFDCVIYIHAIINKSFLLPSITGVVFDHYRVSKCKKCCHQYLRHTCTKYV